MHANEYGATTRIPLDIPSHDIIVIP